MLTLDEVVRYVTRYFWRKTDRIVARAGITLGTDATVLENYTESTWTPEITPTTGSFTTLTYTTQTGKYTRIGNVVYYSAYIAINAFTIGTGSGSARFSLPVAVLNATAANATGTIFMSGVDLGASTRSLAFFPATNTTIGTIYETQDDGAVTTTQCSALAAGDTIAYAGFYFAA